ncbi:MAG: ATPase domain-containing protein [Candidatus Bathyarchaeota archaeon]
MQKNQILISTGFLSCILIFLALGTFFALDSGSEFDMDGMMGGGTTNDYSWIIAIILFGVAIVVAVGLVLYLFNSKKSKSGTQEIVDQIKSENEALEKPAAPIKTSKIEGYLSTGNNKIDNLLYGGIAPNSSVILSASPSHEKDLFVKDFIETGLKNTEIVFYISCDQSFSKSIITEFPTKFQFIACYPINDETLKNSPNVYRVGSITNLTEINITLTKAIRKLDSGNNPKRFVINIVSDVLLQYESVKTRKWLTDILSMLKYDGFTILGIINPKIHSSEDVQAILELFDGEIIINELGDERRLKIGRMNKQKYLKNEIKLT